MGDREPLGLESGRVVLVPYDPRWPLLFEEAAAELRQALGGAALAVHHVGSTAIPGIAAKPVLDILVIIPSLGACGTLTDSLTRIGYEYRPNEEIVDRHFFRRTHGTARTHHLSLAEPDSRYATVTLCFRDALREDHALAEAYERLKLELAERYPADRPAYLEGKSAFVREVLRSRGPADEAG
jgi:GrpB-like predicted nucleotidyltransferase (UPF0157 family)